MSLMERLSGTKETEVAEKVAGEDKDMTVKLYVAHQAYADATEKIANGIQIEMDSVKENGKKEAGLKADAPIETILDRLAKV